MSRLEVHGNDKVWSEEGIESGVGWTPGKEDEEAILARMRQTTI